MANQTLATNIPVTKVYSAIKTNVCNISKLYKLTMYNEPCAT